MTSPYHQSEIHLIILLKLSLPRRLSIPHIYIILIHSKGGKHNVVVGMDTCPGETFLGVPSEGERVKSMPVPRKKLKESMVCACDCGTPKTALLLPHGQRVSEVVRTMTLSKPPDVTRSRPSWEMSGHQHSNGKKPEQGRPAKKVPLLKPGCENSFYFRWKGPSQKRAQ